MLIRLGSPLPSHVKSAVGWSLTAKLTHQSKRLIADGAVVMVLRTVTLLSKLLLVLLLARWLPVRDMGRYGLMTAALSIGTSFIGFDFYIFSTRQIALATRERQGVLIRDQVLFHVMSYSIGLPAIAVLFLIGFLPWNEAFWFYLLLPLEHMAQELYRTLVAMSRPLLANVTLFFRSAAWIYGVALIGFLDRGAFRLSTLWSGWLISLVVTFLIGAYGLRGIPFRSALVQPIDWKWIRSGIRTGSAFFAGTVCIAIAGYVDRYVLNRYYGEQSVGTYVFFANLTNSVFTLVEAGVFLTFLPRLLRAANDNARTIFQEHVSALRIAAMASAVILSVACGGGVVVVLKLVHKPEYSNHVYLLWFQLASSIILVYGMVSHYQLYVRHRDRALVACAMIGVVVSLVSAFTIIRLYGIAGAGISAVISALAVASARTWKNSRVSFEQKVAPPC